MTKTGEKAKEGRKMLLNTPSQELKHVVKKRKGSWQKGNRRTQSGMPETQEKSTLARDGRKKGLRKIRVKGKEGEGRRKGRPPRCGLSLLSPGP